jgi:glycosyltransferase involved in cell wall biosynthesis
VVCLNSQEEKLFAAAGCTARVIPNFILRGAKATLEAKNLLTIGWLNQMKGTDLIPAVAEQVFEKFPDWHWTIIGRGEEKEKTEKALQNSVGSNVSIVEPASPNLTAVYQNASCYVMTSKVECFPMVLLEAMSYGIPCIAFNCPTGPSAIIRHNEDGFLIQQNKTKSMAECIMKLIANTELRRRFGNQAYENISRFSPDAVYALWQKLFTS